MDEDGTDVTSSFVVEGSAFNGYNYLGYVEPNEEGDLVFPYGTTKFGLRAYPASSETTENTLYSTTMNDLPVEDAENLMINSKLTLIAFKAVQPNRALGYSEVYGAGDIFIAETRYLSGSVGSTIDFKMGIEFSGLNLEEQGYGYTRVASAYAGHGCTPSAEDSYSDMTYDAHVVFDSKYSRDSVEGTEEDYAYFYGSYEIGRPFNSPAQYKDAIERTYASNISMNWEHKLKTQQHIEVKYIMHEPIPVRKSQVKVLSVADDTVTDVTSNYDITFNARSFFDANGLPINNGTQETRTFDASGVMKLPIYIQGWEQFKATRTAAAKEGGINTCDVAFQPWTDYETPASTIYSAVDFYFSVVVKTGQASHKQGIALLTDNYLQGTFTGVGPYSAEITKHAGDASYSVDFGTELSAVVKKANMNASAYANSGTNCTVSEAKFIGDSLVANTVVTPEVKSDVCNATMSILVVEEENVPAGYEDWFYRKVNINRRGCFDIAQNISYSFSTAPNQVG